MSGKLTRRPINTKLNLAVILSEKLRIRHPQHSPEVAHRDGRGMPALAPLLRAKRTLLSEYTP
jgi:hypothetical protein